MVLNLCLVGCYESRPEVFPKLALATDVATHEKTTHFLTKAGILLYI
jgi:hypothetical protein